MEGRPPDLFEFMRSSSVGIPMIINKDNINKPLESGTTLINQAFKFGDTSIILYFKSLGARLNDISAYCLNTIEIAMIFLDMGGKIDNNNNVIYPFSPFDGMLVRGQKDVIYFLIDYGINPPNSWFKENPHPRFSHYISTQIVPRTISSRKALVALMICCKQRDHQGTLVFGEVRDVLFAVAREMWAQKGPADKCCGARSTKWVKKPL